MARKSFGRNGRETAAGGGDNFFEGGIEGFGERPTGIVGLEFAEVGNVADVIAFAIFVDVRPVEFFSGQLLDFGNSFEHGDAVFAATSHVVDLAGTGVGGEGLDGANDVVAVNIVANLFSFVAKDGIFESGYGGFHEVRKKAVKFDAGMRRASEAATAKNADVHFEVAAVFLCDQIGSGFGCAKERVKRAVNAAIFGDAVKILGASVFPTRGKFDERNFVGSVAINFVGAKEKENGFGAMLAGGFEEIDGAEGVDFKIENGNVASFVVRRLRGAVNDEIEAARAEKFVECGAVANIHGEVREILGG